MKLEKIEGEAKYLGPAEFNQSGIVLRVIADCAEANRLGLTREINRELKLLFDKNDIVFAVPHVRVIEQGVTKAKSAVTAKTIKKKA